MPILTQRKKPIVDRAHVQCDLKFHKEHLFLCSAPFLWYLREEKFEIQIWTSDSSNGDFSSTDKLLGSIYVDLNSLSNRKRKAHRINAILPMFKHGCKDLGGAWTQVHVTIDKSKDFNELRVKRLSKKKRKCLLNVKFRIEMRMKLSLISNLFLLNQQIRIFSQLLFISNKLHICQLFIRNMSKEIQLDLFLVVFFNDFLF